MSGNFSNRDSNDNAAPVPPSPEPPSEAPRAATKRGRPRIYPDAKVRRREYMREYRKRNVSRETKGQT